MPNVLQVESTPVFNELTRAIQEYGTCNTPTTAQEKRILLLSRAVEPTLIQQHLSDITTYAVVVAASYQSRHQQQGTSRFDDEVQRYDRLRYLIDTEIEQREGTSRQLKQVDQLLAHLENAAEASPAISKDTAALCTSAIYGDFTNKDLIEALTGNTALDSERSIELQNIAMLTCQNENGQVRYMVNALDGKAPELADILQDMRLSLNDLLYYQSVFDPARYSIEQTEAHNRAHESRTETGATSMATTTNEPARTEKQTIQIEEAIEAAFNNELDLKQRDIHDLLTEEKVRVISEVIASTGLSSDLVNEVYNEAINNSYDNAEAEYHNNLPQEIYRSGWVNDGSGENVEAQAWVGQSKNGYHYYLQTDGPGSFEGQFGNYEIPWSDPVPTFEEAKVEAHKLLDNWLDSAYDVQEVLSENADVRPIPGIEINKPNLIREAFAGNKTAFEAHKQSVEDFLTGIDNNEPSNRAHESRTESEATSMATTIDAAVDAHETISKRSRRSSKTKEEPATPTPEGASNDTASSTPENEAEEQRHLAAMEKESGAPVKDSYLRESSGYDALSPEQKAACDKDFQAHLEKRTRPIEQREGESKDNALLRAKQEYCADRQEHTARHGKIAQTMLKSKINCLTSDRLSFSLMNPDVAKEFLATAFYHHAVTTKNIKSFDRETFAKCKNASQREFSAFASTVETGKAGTKDFNNTFVLGIQRPPIGRSNNLRIAVSPLPGKREDLATIFGKCAFYHSNRSGRTPEEREQRKIAKTRPESDRGR